MDEKTRKRYEELKRRNKLRLLEIEREPKGLLKECIEATGAIDLGYDESERMSHEIQTRFPFTRYGRVDFSEFKFKFKINIYELDSNYDVYNDPNIRELESICEFINESTEFYIIWSAGVFNCLRGEIKDIIKSIYDVTAVGPDTFIASLEHDIIIEFYHNGELTIGKLN